MKKVIFLLLAALCCAPAARAFEPLKFGVKAGIQIQSANMSLNNIADELRSLSSDGKIGFQFGAMARLSLPVVYFQPELVYGVNRFEMEGSGQTSTRYNVRTLDVPVLVGTKILFARLFAGPNFNLMTETRIKDGTLSDFNTRFRRSSVGFQVGVGVEFLRKLNVDLRYVGQFKKPVQEITFGGVTQEVRTGVNAWQLNIGYFF